MVDDPFPISRRDLILSAAGIGLLSGCGDSENTTTTTSESPTTSTTASPTPPTTTTTQTTPDTSTQPTTTSSQAVLDRTFRVPIDSRLQDSADFTYNPFYLGYWDGYYGTRLTLCQRSHIDGQYYPELAQEWSYEPGQLTVRLRDDHYWVSDTVDEVAPTKVTAADLVDVRVPVANFPPDTTNPPVDRGKHGRSMGHFGLEHVARSERIDDRTFRLFLDEPYRREIGIRRSIHDQLLFNSAYWRPWVERLREATSGDERTSIINEIGALDPASPHPFTNGPFRLADTPAPDRWVYTLRDDEDRQPRWVDAINYRTVELVATMDAAARAQAFRDGDIPFGGTNMGGLGLVDADVPFETTTVHYPRTSSWGTYVFNLRRPPTDNPHFRRAVAYLLNRDRHRTRFMDGDEMPTGLLTAAQEEQYLPSSFRTMLSEAPHQNYGYASVLREAASAELEAGGFEQDSSGRWLHAAGDSAGEPISIDIPLPAFFPAFNERARAFAETLTEFGIETSVSVAPSDDDGTNEWVVAVKNHDYAITAGTWGGAFASDTYEHAFGEAEFYMDPVPGVPDEWEGPPVGKVASPPSAATDETETFDVANLLGLLDINPDGFPERVARLAWVYNQIVAYLPVGHMPRIYTLNQRDWDWPLPVDDHPFAWTSVPSRRSWQRGVVSARPRSG